MKLHKDVKDKRDIKRIETLESDFRKVHGDKYDYSLVEYINASTKVKIICKTFFNSNIPIYDMFIKCSFQYVFFNFVC